MFALCLPFVANKEKHIPNSYRSFLSPRNYHACPRPLFTFGLWVWMPFFQLITNMETPEAGDHRLSTELLCHHFHAYQKPPFPQFTHNPFTTRWSSLPELSAGRTRNPAVDRSVLASSPSLTTMFHCNLSSNLRPRL